MTTSNHISHRLAWLRTWKGLAAAVGALLLLFAWWLIPAKIDRVETVDGAHSWRADRAPARRLFVWSPAAALDELTTAGGSLIRPHLADGGGTLYFTLRRPSGQADIFRSRFSGGAWTRPEPAEEFNGPADDLGLVLSGDGREAYFYSNRPGGFGGFDLYVSRLQADGWSSPQNLGQRINTPAHEYDPAIAPDGLSLLFASNRTAQMQDARRLADEEREGENAKPQANGEHRDWSATLRAQPGQSTFDLYAAQRPVATADWMSPTPLADLNRPDSNEGAPALAPGGVHVYFASDRPGGSGGFDLYRAKLNGRVADEVENLGPSVNTAADELEPGLSPEGFSLLFSSNRDEQAEESPPTKTFALYRSLAVEVTEESGWDDSNWLAFAGVWWWAALLLLGAALVVFFWIYSHRWVAEAAVAFRFFLASLMFHVLLVLLLAFMMIREQVLEIRDELAARDEVEEFIDVLPEPAPEPGLSPFDKTAELTSSEQTAAVQRQPQSEPLAQPSEPPRATISQELARRLPPELVTRVAPPQVEPAKVDPQELTRRTMDLPRRIELLDEALELDAEQARPETAVNPAVGELARAAQKSPTRSTPDAPRPEVFARAARPLPPARSTAAPRSEPAEMPDLVRRNAAETEPTVAAQVAEDSAALAAAQVAAEKPVGDAPVQAKSSTAPAEGSSPAAVAARSMSDIPDRTTTTVVSRSPADRDFKPNTNEATRLPRSTAQAILDAAELMPAADAPLIAGQSANDLAQLAMSDAGPLRGAEQGVAALDTTATTDKKPQLGEAATRPLAIGPAGAAAAPTKTETLALARAASPPELAQAAALGEAALAALAGEARPGDQPLAGLLEAARGDDPARGVAMTSPGATMELKDRQAEPAQLLTRRSLDATELTPAGGDPARMSDDFAVAEIEDRVSVRQMFALRSDERKPFIEEFGGTAESERAIELGLAWLAKIQKEDGHWQLQDHQGGVQSDTAAVGFALLPFLGQGKTHKKGEYQPAVERGLKWLVEHQKPDGDLFSGGAGNAQMYSHGAAAIALCEAYGMTRDEALRGPAQKALDFIVAAQHKGTGGWRYHPGDPGDTSVVGWQVMALKSGEMAGLNVPQQALDLSNKWLDSAEGKDAARGQFGYQGPGGSAAMTAEGLLCRQFLGAGRRDPSMKAGADFLLARLPQPGQESSYYWYYATQVMYHMQGEYWQKWNEALRDTLVKSQDQGGDQAGSWPPSDVWEQQGGRIYATSLRLLMLEVYYRHLPLYRQLGP